MEIFSCGAQDDFMFGWWFDMGDVCKTIRVWEAKFDTRARSSSTKIPTPRGITSSFKIMFSLSLIDENEEMVDLEEKEYDKGYKCDDGNNDDDNDNFVDFEDE